MEEEKQKDEPKIKGLRDYLNEDGQSFKPELEQKLKEIKMKLLANKQLSPEEKLLKYEYEEQLALYQQQLAEAKELARTQAFQNEQQRLKDEATKTPPEEILNSEIKGTYLKKGTGFLNEFLAKRAMSKVAEKAKKKGGTVIEKVYADSSIELIWTKSPVKFVEFVTINERGEKVKTISRVSKTKHRLKGTPVPVQVVLEGVSENINLHEGADMSLSAQHINQMNMLFYEAGYLDALDAKEQKKEGFSMDKLLPILILIAIGISIIVAWQMSQLYTKIEAIGPAIEALKASAAPALPAP